MSFSHYKEGSL